MKKLISIFILLILSNINLYSQYKSIMGKVISEKFETMSFVSIIINDTVEVGRTDLNGFFQIDIPISVKKIIFRSVGLDPAIIEILDTCNEVEVVMFLSSTYDFKTPKKVNRLRKKRYKKLPEIQKEAFIKGIFKTNKPCFSQVFMPSY